MTRSSTALALGFGLLFLGAMGFYFVGRRQFNRRNEMGVEIFPSFMSMLLNRGLEIVVRVASIVMLLFGFGGLIASMPRGMKEAAPKDRKVASALVGHTNSAPTAFRHENR